MTEPIESEPNVEPILLADPEPEISQDIPDIPQDEPAGDLDYDRIIGGVTEKIAKAALALQTQQQQPADPYSDLGQMLWDNPSEVLRAHGEMIRQQTLHDMMPYVQPVAQNYAMSQVLDGLDEHGQQFAQQFIREKGIDPALLSDPTVADLVRSKAELHQIKRSGRMSQMPIPSTEQVGGYPSAHVDARTQQELNGMERLYRSLGVRFDPAKILGRIK